MLALAFSGDPPCRWAWPDPQQYLEAFPQFARAFGGSAIQHGTANYYERFAGVALWLAPRSGPDEASLISVIQNTVAAARRQECSRCSKEWMRSTRRKLIWHLPLIGVDPAQRARKWVRALLRQVLNDCDRQKLLAYLEGTSPQNVRLYQRHGFEPLGTIEVADAPQVVPMLRTPKS